MDLSRQRSRASRAQSMHDVNTNDSLFRTQAPRDGSMPGGRGPLQIPRDAQSYTTEFLHRCNSDTFLRRASMEDSIALHTVVTDDASLYRARQPLFRTQAPMDGSMPGGRGPHQIPRDAQSYTTELLRRCNSDTSLLHTQMPPDGPMPADRGSMDLSRQRSRASRAQSMHDVNTNDSLFRTQAPRDGSMPGGRGPLQIPRDAQSYTTEFLHRCNS